MSEPFNRPGRGRGGDCGRSGAPSDVSRGQPKQQFSRGQPKQQFPCGQSKQQFSRGQPKQQFRHGSPKQFYYGPPSKPKSDGDDYHLTGGQYKRFLELLPKVLEPFLQKEFGVDIKDPKQMVKYMNALSGAGQEYLRAFLAKLNSDETLAGFGSTSSDTSEASEEKEDEEEEKEKDSTN